MASITFPYHLCEVVVNEPEIAFDNNVRRPEYQSGLIAQKRFTAQPKLARTVQIRVLQQNLVAFTTWLKENGHKTFNFRDDYMGREQFSDVNIRGGAGAVQLKKSNLQSTAWLSDSSGTPKTTPDKGRYWSAEVTMEGFV